MLSKKKKSPAPEKKLRFLIEVFAQTAVTKVSKFHLETFVTGVCAKTSIKNRYFFSGAEDFFFLLSII